MKSHIIFALLFLFSCALSQYITTARTFDEALLYQLQELQGGFEKPLLDALQGKTFQDISKEQIVIKNIKPVSTDPNLEDTYCDMKNSFLLVSPEKLSITFNFDYLTETVSKKGELDLRIYDVLIYLKTKNEGSLPDASVEIVLKEKDFAVYAPDVLDKQPLQKIFSENKAAFIKIIGEAIKETFNKNTMAILSKKPPFSFTTSAALGKRQVTINLNEFVGFCDDPKGDFVTSVCYFSGNASNKVDRKQRGAGLIDDFLISNSGDKKVFINREILPDILSKLNEQQKVTMMLNKNSPFAAQLSYGFTVKSLKEICTDQALAPFKEQDEFEVSNYIDAIYFKDDELHFKISSSIDIKDNKKVVLIEIEGKLNMMYVFENQRPKFNLCFKKYANIDIVVKTENTIKDLAKTKELISETLEKAGELCLSDDKINLRDYLYGFKTTRITKDGLYFGGRSLY